MITSHQSPLFRTPDKRSAPDTLMHNFATTIQKQKIVLPPTIEFKTPYSANKFGPVLTLQRLREQKTIQLQQKVEKLKDYLSKHQEIDKKCIKQIFKLTDDCSEYENSEQQILKQLSSRVKKLIKVNREIRQNTYQDELSILKKQNKRFQTLIEDLSKGQHIKTNKKLEINQNFYQKIQKTNGTDLIKIQQASQEITGSIQQQKRFFVNYINSIVQRNDQRLQAQGKYIDSLLKKIDNLQNIDKKLEHLKFEKKVWLQTSSRKTKVQSVKIQKIKGENDIHLKYDQNDKDEPIIRPIFNQIEKHNQELKQQLSSQNLRNQIKQLVLFNRKLNEDYDILKEKYQLKLEQYLSDKSTNLELTQRIKIFQTEQKQFIKKKEELNDQLKIYHQKIVDLEDYLLAQERGPNAQINFTFGPSPKSALNVSSELRNIKQEMLTCNLVQFRQIEEATTKLVLQRNSLRRQLKAIQNTRASQSKYSALQKEIFDLKERVAQLEQNCQLYEIQLSQYSAKPQNSFNKRNKNIYKDFSFKIDNQINKNTLNSDNPESSVLKWQRMTHNCMLSSITRLQNLQKILNNRTVL